MCQREQAIASLRLTCSTVKNTLVGLLFARQFNRLQQKCANCGGHNVISFNPVATLLRMKVLKYIFHELFIIIIRFFIPVVFINELDWSVFTCITQLYLMVYIYIQGVSRL